MKLLQALGCVLFLWSVGLIDTGDGASVRQRQQRQHVNGTNPTNAVSLDGVDEENEDFVPFQGERFNTFDWTLFRTMGKLYSDNFLISPISAKLALILLYEGAQDHTARELAGALQLPASRSAIRDQFSAILRSLRAMSPRYELDIGTRVYVDSNISTRQRYAAIIKTFYSVDLIETNLSDSRSITHDVNTWVKNVTKGNIDRLVEESNNLADSMMLVINALFFKGTWRRQYFPPQSTQPGMFYANGNEKVEVSYMTTINRFYYSESMELDAKILRLPYKGQKFAMYLILPNSYSGIDYLTKEINPFILSRHTWLMQELPIEVTIPKFKFDYSSYLEPALREMGIRDIFDDTATLTGIAKTKRDSRHLVVSDIVQKVGIEVNENGTSAYAATGIQVGNKIADQSFNADHPFLFYIEDETTGTILYIGKITNPLQREGGTDGVRVDLTSRFGEETGSPTSGVATTPNADERYNFFNIDLLQAVNKEVDGNVIMSPASAKLALTVLAEGAKGQTKDELHAALRLPEDLEQVRAIAQRTLVPLKSFKNGTEIDVATRLWARKGVSIRSEYANVLSRYYGTEVTPLDFAAGNIAEETINNWVAAATRNNIRTIVEPGTLNAGTTLILTSALYFKGRWQKSFAREAGFTGCFQVPKLGCQDIFFMSNTAKYRYGYVPSLQVDVVEIPYTDGRTAMIILLPSNQKLDPELQILSKDLSYVPMSVLLGNLRLVEVNLIIPKFTIESKLDLKPALERMGVHTVFEMGADLSRIVNEGTVRVSSILQNAKIEVDEDGTIAAAATGLSIVPLMGRDTVNFRANRPFIFAIVDLLTNSTLFAGRYMRPN